MFEITVSSWAVFVSNFLIGGWMVSVDAALFLAVALAFIKPERRLGVVTMITLAHAVYGFLGLGVMALGAELSSAMKIGVWAIIAFSSFLGLRFITEGLGEEESEENHAEHGNILNHSLFSLSALSLYTAVSIDELFAVTQKYQWMLTQGWNHGTMAANIAASMVMLFIFLGASSWLIERSEGFAAWLEEHGEQGMFIVFSLIMYYLVRGVVQNGLGYHPWEIPFTGIAPELLPMGFVLTWFLQKILADDSREAAMKRILLLH